MGYANEYEFNDLRARIAEHGCTGYSFEFEHKRYDISVTGKVNDWPYGLFDFNENAIARIFKVQIAKHKKEKEENIDEKCDCGAYPTIHQGPGKPVICSNCNQEL